MIIEKIIKKFKFDLYRNVKELDYEELKELIKSNSDIKIVDIRSPQEFAERKINYAINIPLYELNKKAGLLLPDKNEMIIVYCQYGMRSKKAYQILKQKGYSNVYSLKGGLESVC